MSDTDETRESRTKGAKQSLEKAAKECRRCITLSPELEEVRADALNLMVSEGIDTKGMVRVVSTLEVDDKELVQTLTDQDCLYLYPPLVVFLIETDFSVFVRKYPEAMWNTKASDVSIPLYVSSGPILRPRWRHEHRSIRQMIVQRSARGICNIISHFNVYNNCIEHHMTERRRKTIDMIADRCAERDEEGEGAWFT